MQYNGNKLRHELKYYINDSVYYTLRQRLLHTIGPDPNMKDPDGYLITSVYFDDIYGSARDDKVKGCRFRKKFRLRSYDRNDSLIRLECKSKFDEYISKTNAVLTRQEYDKILHGEYEFLARRPETVCRELLGCNRTRLLKPRVAVEYKREAYIAAAGNVRITFDKEIAVSMASIDMFDKRFVTSKVIPEYQMVLEVKYDDFLPGAVQMLLKTAMTEKCAISKYVMCMDKKRMVRYI